MTVYHDGGYPLCTSYFVYASVEGQSAAFPLGYIGLLQTLGLGLCFSFHFEYWFTTRYFLLYENHAGNFLLKITWVIAVPLPTESASLISFGHISAAHFA